MKTKKWRYTVWEGGESSIFEDKGGSLHSDALIAQEIKNESDAKLIASAPEILELLIKVSNLNQVAKEHISEDFINRVESIIKKATA
jgi:hypothetical protein